MIKSKLFIYWFVAFIIASIAVVNSHFKSSNDDSKYYSEMVVRYQHESLSNILTPKWGINYYSYAPDSYMQDQFPGQLMMGVLATKLGVPAEHALHLVEMIFQLLSIYLLVRIAGHFITDQEASFLYYAILLTPMAFSYNLRGNHEAGIMFFCFLALFSGIKLSSGTRYGFYAVLSSVMLLLIKGPFFIFALILLPIGYWYSKERAKISKLILIHAICSLAIILTAYLFETIFTKITGTSFLAEFFRIQIQNRALEISNEHSFIVKKILNFYYYFSRYLIYSLGWSLLALIICVMNVFNKQFRIRIRKFLESPLSKCFLASAFSFCFLFTMSDRTASRYVFPAYYLFSAWVILLLLGNVDWIKKIHSKISDFGLHYVAPLIWLISILLHLIN